MKAYPDTSFLCNLYRQQVFTPQAITYRRAFGAPLPFTSLLEFEFKQSIRLQTWLRTKDATKGFGKLEAEYMLADWEHDVAAGLNKQVAYDAEAVNRLAQSFSAAHVYDGGHRTMDLLHVATAVHLQAEDFLSFDQRQIQLANKMGLTTPMTPTN